MARRQSKQQSESAMLAEDLTVGLLVSEWGINLLQQHNLHRTLKYIHKEKQGRIIHHRHAPGGARIAGILAKRMGYYLVAHPSLATEPPPEADTWFNDIVLPMRPPWAAIMDIIRTSDIVVCVPRVQNNRSLVYQYGEIAKALDKPTIFVKGGEFAT